MNGSFAKTVISIGAPRSQNVDAVAKKCLGESRTPTLADDVQSLALLFHQLVSKGSHYLFGPNVPSSQFEQLCVQHYRLPQWKKNEKLHKLKFMLKSHEANFFRESWDARNLLERKLYYTDAADFFLFIADGRNR